MDSREQTTGTPDEHYDLISVLYHALHGAENCKMYMADAEAAGKEDLAAFFREARAMHAAMAEQAKGHLGIGGTTPGDIQEGGLAGGARAKSGVVTSGGVREDAASGPTGSRREEQPVADIPDEPADAPRRAVPPDAPRTQDPPPRTGDAPPSPSEQPIR